MLALASVWIALASLVLSVAMLVYRPLFTDWSVTLVLYFGSPGALCFAGMVLWTYRKETGSDAGVEAQRTQATVAVVLALIAAAIVYGLVMRAERVPRIEPAARSAYNAAPRNDYCRVFLARLDRPVASARGGRLESPVGRLSTPPAEGDGT